VEHVVHDCQRTHRQPGGHDHEPAHSHGQWQTPIGPRESPQCIDDCTHYLFPLPLSEQSKNWTICEATQARSDRGLGDWHGALVWHMCHARFQGLLRPAAPGIRAVRYRLPELVRAGRRDPRAQDVMLAPDKLPCYVQDFEISEVTASLDIHPAATRGRCELELVVLRVRRRKPCQRVHADLRCATSTATPWGSAGQRQSAGRRPPVRPAQDSLAATKGNSPR
jgi:hypothetical protein